MNHLESTFEKQVIRHFRSIGYFAAHLNGTEGIPDLIVLRAGRFRLFELKIVHINAWRELAMHTIFERSQPAFALANPELEIMALISTDDGIFIFCMTEKIAKKIPDGLRFRDITLQPWKMQNDNTEKV